MRHALIVDDTATFSEFLREALQSLGFTADVAEDGVQAFDTLSVTHADIILLDIIMPRLDGLSFLKMLRAHPNWNAIPVVLISGAPDSLTVHEAIRLGVRHILTKEELSISRLRSILDDCARRPITGDGRTACLPCVDAAESFSTERFRTLAQLSEQAQALLNLPFEDREVDEHIGAIEKDVQLRTQVVAVANAFHTLDDRSTARRNDFGQVIAEFGQDEVLSAAAAIRLTEQCYAEFSLRETAHWCEHSLAVCRIADRLTERWDRHSRRFVRAVGLCHELPLFFLSKLFPREYAYALEGARTAPFDMYRALSACTGKPLDQLAREILKQLGIAEHVAQGVVDYLWLELGDSRGSASPFSMVIRYANYYAHALGFTVWPDSPVTSITRKDYLPAVGIIATEPFKARELAQSIRGATAAMMKLAASTLQVGQSNTHKIWLCRHSAYINFDPLEHLLRSMAEVDVWSSLPSHPDRLNGYAGVVVAAPDLNNEEISHFHLTYLSNREDQRMVPIFVAVQRSHTTPPSTGQNVPLEVHTMPVSPQIVRNFISRCIDAQSS